MSEGGRWMFTENAFAELSAVVPPALMKAYVLVMIVLVVAGTLLDVWHKRSADYFFANWRQGAKAKGAAEGRQRRGHGRWRRTHA